MMNAQLATLACGLLGVGIVLGASNVGPYITAQVAVDKELQSSTTGYQSGPKLDGPPPAMPICDCSTRNFETYLKEYSGSQSDACVQMYPDPSLKRWFRDSMAEHKKTICKNGIYWTCTYTELHYQCTSVMAKPDCPQDTCVVN